jgi:hypothetical protein
VPETLQAIKDRLKALHYAEDDIETVTTALAVRCTALEGTFTDAQVNALLLKLVLEER